MAGLKTAGSKGFADRLLVEMRAMADPARPYSAMVAAWLDGAWLEGAWVGGDGAAGGGAAAAGWASLTRLVTTCLRPLTMRR